MIREFLIKVDVPEWATCYAIDANGAVYYYKEKPVVDEDEDDTMWIANGRIGFTGIYFEPDSFGDWRETLREIKWAS